MAIDIKFDLVGNPEPPTIILANRNGNKLGQLKVDTESVELSDKFNDASELSFTINKYADDKLTPLWSEVVDFKLIYCKEWDCWFEIKVELDEATESIKTVYGTQLGQAELSQIMLYNIEINTEEDILRDDYELSVLYDRKNPKASILHRLLDKAPHYSIAYVDPTIEKIQKSFSFDGTSIYDAFNDIAEEIGCLFVYHSNSDENGMPNRAISVYDLEQNCNDCGYRGEFTDTCPNLECPSKKSDYESKGITYGYGEDTLIFVTSDELATEGIQLVTDTDAVKNCFKLEAGDDLMTATIRNCNPNGTDYIWYFSDSTKQDMSKELVDKIESYDELYKDYCNNYESALDVKLLNGYNALVEKYKDYYNTPSTCLNCDYEDYFYNECPKCGSKIILSGQNLPSISTPIKGYAALMNAYYDTIDLAVYLKSGLMPNVKMSSTNAEEQVKLLEDTLPIHPVAVDNIKTAQRNTINSAVLAMAKVIVKPTYKVDIKESDKTGIIDNNDGTKTWTGKIEIVNYSDENDEAISKSISVKVNDDKETFIKQKIEKSLNKENTDDYSISALFEKDVAVTVVNGENKFSGEFYEELKKYALNPLTNFYEACEGCRNILISQGVGEDTTSDLYKNLYIPFRNKSMAIEAEIKIREDEVNLIVGVYNDEGFVEKEGLQTNIISCKNQIQHDLNFESYLRSEDLWLEFCSYRREDKYSNENYISDGLNNTELFKKASEFIKVAEKEIYKSSELQHSISATLNNLLAIPKFKSLVKSFKTGNWIRVQVNDKIYKLRLLEYDIAYKDFNTISVEFSDVSKIKNSFTNIEGVLSQASSMATSYDAVKRQSKQGNAAQNSIEQWRVDGLNTSLFQIKNNDSEEIIITKNGLLGRSHNDITGEYSSKQIKLTHNTLAYTDDNWDSVCLAIGEYDYYTYDKANGEFINKTGYGINADAVTAGVVIGSQVIGGDIYSDNYSSSEGTGSHLNLIDGTFSFAGGKLTYDGDHLSVNGEITVATSGTIGCWDIDRFSIYKGSNIFGNEDGMYFGTDGLSLGSNFSVVPEGILSCNNADITGKFTSVSDNAKLNISSGFIELFYNKLSEGDEGDNINSAEYSTVKLLNENNVQPTLYMNEYNEAGVQTSSTELSSHHLRIGGTNTEPSFYVFTGKEGGNTAWVRLQLPNDKQGKYISWKNNNDGTYTLIGTDNMPN